MQDPDERMTDRERLCYAKWLEAAIDLEDPALAAYWQAQGLEARRERLFFHTPSMQAETPKRRRSRSV